MFERAKFLAYLLVDMILIVGSFHNNLSFKVMGVLKNFQNIIRLFVLLLNHVIERLCMHELNYQ